MTEWLKEFALAVLGSGAVAGGIGWWFKSRRDDRKEKEKRENDRADAYTKSLEDRCEKLQEKVESLLMDAIAREKESNTQAALRLEMDRELMRVIFSNSSALKASAVALTHTEKTS